MSDRKQRTAARRRVEYGVMIAITLIAVTATVGLTNVLASRFGPRIDVTFTREHRLAPRTQSLLERLSGPCEIIVSHDPRAVSRRAQDRVGAVLSRLEANSPNVRVTRLDRGGESGERAFDSLVARLIERDAEAIDAQARTIQGAIDSLRDLGAFFGDVLSPSLRRAADAAREGDQQWRTHAAWLVGKAAAVEAAQQRLTDVIADTQRAITSGRVRATPVPDTLEASSRLSAQLGPMAESLNLLLTDFEALAQVPGAPDIVGPILRDMTTRLRTQRDTLAQQAERITAMQPLDILRIRAVLEHEEGAVLVAGPPGTGLTAIEFQALFPPAVLLDSALGAGIDLHGRAEELFATAIASLIDPARPIVVLVHGERAAIARDPAVFGMAIERLSLRGMDVVEWAAALDERPPPLGAYSPGTRPVVYIVHNTDSGAGDPNDPQMSGPARAVKLGRAVRWIVDSGHPLLLSIAPSSLPAARQPDPTVEVLAQFGLRSDSGRVLMRGMADARGPSIATERRLIALDTDHPIARACAGLPTLLNWCTPVHVGEAPQRVPTNAWEIYAVRDDVSWAESNWHGLARVPREHWPLMESLPANDSPNDDASGRWPIVVAAERWTRDDPRRQRLIAVGANAWFASDVLRAYGTLDGRLVPLAPGNAELLEASILWLAGHDALIAQTASARSLPLVKQIDSRNLTLLRWALVGVMPLGALLLGVMWRLIRG